MEGFKPVVKMKTGGSVSKAIAAAEKKEERAEAGMHEDVKQDKKLVKKAINLHDDQLHEGKKTDLSTLKKGGRCKKETGTVRVNKCGGGKVKKMAVGGLTDPTTQAIVNADVLRRRKAAQMAGQGIAAPNAVPGQQMSAPAAAPTAPVGQPTAPDMGTPPPGPVMKKGGKVKGCK